MGFVSEFLHQKTPAPGRVMPAYYRKALAVSEMVLACYFLAAFFFFPIAGGPWEWVPVALSAGTALSFVCLRRKELVRSFIVFSVMVLLWSAWGVYTFGWNVGVQHFMVVLLLLLFFNIYIAPPLKIVSCLLLLGFRIGLYVHCLRVEPVRDLKDTGAGILFQTGNSVVFFLLVALICVLFSSSIQDTERRLRLDNENLNRAAGTDPLTGLPNRRKMIGIIERFQKDFPDRPFSVAIADIDLFKTINDTYGHACGDAALVALTRLFTEESAGRYQACRWGGEEFCFFLPEKNLDEAGVIMNDLNFAVEKMDMEFEGRRFKITITVGVEETDFHSTLEELLASADAKLYLGKNTGRNRVIV